MNKTTQALVKLGETAGNYRKEGWLWWVNDRSFLYVSNWSCLD